MDYKTEPFVCLFCAAALPEPESYQNQYKCGCGAIYGFEISPEETGDAWEFYLEAADSLGIPDGEPGSRIDQLETRHRLFDVLDEGTEVEECVEVFFARVKKGN